MGADLAVSLAIVAIALALGLLIVAVAGYSVSATVSALWQGAFVGSQSIDGTLETAVVLVLGAVAWIVAFRAGRINVGAEGQMLAGGIVATIVGLDVGGADRPLHLAFAVLGGAFGGALLAGVAAGLWAWRRVNEIISTFLLNLIAGLIVLWLVTGPLQEPTHSSPISASVPNSSRWPGFPGQPFLSWDVLYIPLIVVLLAGTLRWTRAGFALRVCGANERAAQQAGVSVRKVGVIALVTSGAIAGLAGSSLILASPSGAMQAGFSSNLGYEGIAVALLARNTPVAAIAPALLFAAISQGAGLAEVQVGLDPSLVDIAFGLVVILAAAAPFLAQRMLSMTQARPDAGEWRAPKSRSQ